MIFSVLDNFFRFGKKLGFWVFLVHPTVVSVLLSASVERFDVSRMRDFYRYLWGCRPRHQVLSPHLCKYLRGGRPPSQALSNLCKYLRRGRPLPCHALSPSDTDTVTRLTTDLTAPLAHGVWPTWLPVLSPGSLSCSTSKARKSPVPGNFHCQGVFIVRMPGLVTRTRHLQLEVRSHLGEGGALQDTVYI